MKKLKAKQNKIVPYFMSIALVAVTTFLGGLIKGDIEPTNIVIFYLLIVVMTAVWWGRYPAILTSLLSVLAFDYFLVPPYLTFAVSDVQYVFTFIGLLAVGLVVSALASKTRQQAMDARADIKKIWDKTEDVEESLHLLRVTMSNLRNKIEPDPDRPAYILTEPCVGYRLCTDM